jgi:uncharacterized membrane protein YjfL (UPF0719 family)
LDFFSLTANASLATSGNVNGYINSLMQSIQQTSTVAFYQVGPSTQVLSIAVYPSGAYTTTTLVAAAQGANATGGQNIGIPTANVSNVATFTSLVA